MPQYIIIVFAIITLFKDTFKGIDKRWLYGIGIGVMLYILWKRYGNQVSDTLKNDVDTNPLARMCTDLKDAFNPSGLEWFENFDGTDENRVIEVAGQLKASGKTYSELADTWTKIYSTNLTDRLTAEGVKDDFFNIIATGGTSTGGGSTGGTSTGGTGVIKYGSVVVAVADNYNLRHPTDFTVQRKTKAGEEFTVTTVASNKTIAGTTGTWYAVKKSEFTTIPPYYIPSYVSKSYWIFAGGIKLKK